MITTMNVTINEKAITIPDYTSLQGALNLAGIDPTDIATAVNGNVIPLVDRDETMLSDGDDIQVISPLN